jgi:hypothetical protein
MPFVPPIPSVYRLVGIGVLVSSCGTPGVATPMPEPLSLVPSRVGAPQEAMPALYPAPITFIGDSEAAPANSTLRVTNLDGTTEPVITTTRADGGFTVSVSATVGNELRFVALVGDHRVAPVDVRIEADHTFSLVQRPACVELDPGYALEFGKAMATGNLGIKNACADSITLSTPRLRLGLPDFAVPSGLPVTLLPGESSVLTVGFAADSAVSTAPVRVREDVLFVDVTELDARVRYPFTLVGEAP